MLLTNWDSSQKLADVPGKYTNIQPATLKLSKPPIIEAHQPGDDTYNEAYQAHEWLAIVEDY